MDHLHVAEPAVRDVGGVKAGDEPVPDAGVTVPAMHEDNGDGGWIACHRIQVYFPIR
jgi:hypothetical protein